jgi:endoglucanase
VFRELEAAAESLGFHCAVQASGASSGTDADGMIKSGPGTATGLISVPLRYMHSPNEIISFSDLEQAATLLATFARRVTSSSDFRP